MIILLTLIISIITLVLAIVTYKRMMNVKVVTDVEANILSDMEMFDTKDRTELENRIHHPHERMWRALARVEGIDKETETIHVIFPSWDAEHVFALPFNEVPRRLIESVENGNIRHYAKMNLGAESVEEITIRDWEVTVRDWEVILRDGEVTK